MPCSSRGQSQSGQRGGSSYTSTVRSQYGQSPSRIAGGCPVSFGIGIGIALGGSGLLPASAGSSPTLNQGDRSSAEALPGQDTVRPSRIREGRTGGRGVLDATRLPSPCGCGACRARCRYGRVRAASSSPTCCRSKASWRTPGPRSCDRTDSACWPSGATGPTGPGNSPPPSRSLPFVALTEGGIGRPSSSCDSNDGRDRFIPGFRPGLGRHEDATDLRTSVSCLGTPVSASR